MGGAGGPGSEKGDLMVVALAPVSVKVEAVELGALSFLLWVLSLQFEGGLL